MRPLTERWLTRPWRPWQKTRVHCQPMRDALLIDKPPDLTGYSPGAEKIIVMHPDTWRQYSGRA